MLKAQKGFSLIETVIVIGISLMLFGAITFNLFRAQSRSTIRANSDTIASDLRSQQTKAMTGATEGRSTPDSYGVYFLQDRYVLFHGNSYDPNDSSNFVVNLPTNTQILNTTFPNDTVIFSALSGEILGASASGNSVTIKTVNANDEFTITVNRLGVITAKL